MVTLDIPYLPDIIRAVVVKVNAVTTNYPVVGDRFTVGFNHGLLEQVAKDIYDTNTADVLIWLPMTFDQLRGEMGVFGETKINLLIGCKTDNTYTQLQRDQFSFKPKLIPVYQELLKALEKTKEIASTPNGQRPHKMRFNPYWAGSEPGGADTVNLWSQFIDAIVVTNLDLKLKKLTHCP